MKVHPLSEWLRGAAFLEGCACEKCHATRRKADEAADALDAITAREAGMREALEELFRYGFAYRCNEPCVVKSGWCDAHSTSSPCVVGKARAALGR